jgi:hypothetical protein
MTRKLTSLMVITDTLRRSDNGYSSTGSGALPCFHGYLTPAEAEKRLEGAAPGAYLFYLSERRAHTILLCFKSPAGNETRHKAIYRHDYGYSFSRTRRGMPSLMQTCGWYLAGNPTIWGHALQEQLFDDNCLEKIQPEFDMHPLWACLAVPEPEEKHTFAGDAYPTLRALITKNKSFLTQPINTSLDGACCFLQLNLPPELRLTSVCHYPY